MWITKDQIELPFLQFVWYCKRIPSIFFINFHIFQPRPSLLLYSLLFSFIQMSSVYNFENFLLGCFSVRFHSLNKNVYLPINTIIIFYRIIIILFLFATIVGQLSLSLVTSPFFAVFQSNHKQRGVSYKDMSPTILYLLQWRLCWLFRKSWRMFLLQTQMYAVII